MSGTRFHETRRIVALAAPIAATQLLTMLLWTVDFWFVAGLGVRELNAVSLGRLFVVGTSILAMGLVCGQDALSAQAHGARQRQRLAGVFQHAWVLALLLALPLGALWWNTGAILVRFGQDPETAALAQAYVRVQIPALPCFLLFFAFKQYLQTRGIVRPELWIALGANVVNAALDQVLIFGRYGAPRLGAVGAGVATAISEVLMCAAMLAAIRLFRLQRGSATRLDPRRLRFGGFAEIVRLGAPLAVMFALEYWAFAIATLWAGRLGATELAAHSIVLNLASISYMVPLGIGLAATTRVGNLIGAGEPRTAQRAAHAALALGAAAMAAFAIAFVAGRNLIPALYTPVPAVIALAATLLPVVAAFELFDGLQAVGCGVLRGMGRTRPAAIFNLVGYYGLGLPLAGWLSEPARLGLAGVWWGLAAGLFVVAALAVVWVVRRGPATAVALVR